jgi:hypothetical protein
MGIHTIETLIEGIIQCQEQSAKAVGKWVQAEPVMHVKEGASPPTRPWIQPLQT